MTIKNTLRSLWLLPLVANCSPPMMPCHSADSVDRALDEMCPGDDQRADAGPPTTCVPSAGTICTVIGTGIAGNGAEAIAGTRTRAYLPLDVTAGADGNVYYVDWNNHRIRALRANDLVYTIAGSGELSDGDAMPGSMPTRMPEPALSHRLNHPTGLAFDPQGRLLIAAWHNSEVKRVDLTTSVLETIVGTGARSFGGDGAAAFDSMLNLPVSVAIHPMTNELYIADQANQRIRAVNSMGMINTVVGNGMRGFGGDGGPATQAQLNNPLGQAAAPAGNIVFDAAGNLYIADTGNHRIRKVDAMGVITTVAGIGTPGTMGDGGPAVDAQLNGPTDVEIGADGTLYIVDTQNSCVRKVGADGRISTVAGRCGQRGFSGDGGMASMSLLDRPYGIDTEANGNLWIADTYNQRVRLICSMNGGARCTAGQP